MRWFPPKLPDRKALPKGKPADDSVVRRTEILVEKTLCSMDVLGTFQLKPGERCPVCGQDFHPAGGGGKELADGDFASSPPQKAVPPYAGQKE